MRGLLLTASLVLLAGCDGAPAEPEPSPGWMEGTVTLPDGTERAFRDAAGSHAFEYSGIGSRDHVVIATAYAGQPVDETGRSVSVRLSQEGDRFVAGTFSPRRDGTAPPMGATFTVADVPGYVSRAPVRSPANVSVVLPLGTVEVRVEGDRLRGTFDLVGWPISGGTLDGVDVRDLPDERAPRVRGRFDAPVPPPPPGRP